MASVADGASESFLTRDARSVRDKLRTGTSGSEELEPLGTSDDRPTASSAPVRPINCSWQVFDQRLAFPTCAPSVKVDTYRRAALKHSAPAQSSAWRVAAAYLPLTARPRYGADNRRIRGNTWWASRAVWDRAAFSAHPSRARTSAAKLASRSAHDSRLHRHTTSDAGLQTPPPRIQRSVPRSWKCQPEVTALSRRRLNVDGSVTRLDGSLRNSEPEAGAALA